MKRACLVWTDAQRQWLRNEIEIRRWYAQVTSHPESRKAMYAYELAMFVAVQKELDSRLHNPDVAIWSWWIYWWSVTWISMEHDRENVEGLCFRRQLVAERNAALALLPPRARYEPARPTYN